MRVPLQKTICIIITLLLCALCAGCQTRTPPEKAVLGLCLPILGEGFEGSLLTEARKAAAEAGIASLIETVSSQANGVIDASISELIEKKADAVVLYAPDEEQCIAAANQLKEAQIPLILIGGPIDPELYTALISGDYEGMGRAAGEAIAERLNYQGSVLILSGPPGSMTDTMNRAFTEALFPYADMEILTKEPAAGIGGLAVAMVESRLKVETFHAIFAQNDEMAIAASNVLKSNLSEDVLIVTGMGGSSEALEMLMKNNRYLKLTFWNSSGMAAEAVHTAKKIMAGEEFERDTIFPLTPITAKNAAQYAGSLAVPAPTSAPSAVPQAFHEPSPTKEIQTLEPPEQDGVFIRIEKEKRLLQLWKDRELLMSCPIGLGFAPSGDKVREGDGKTPEGLFYICTRNDQSRFYLSLGLSYPNGEDAQRGLAEGLITKDQAKQITSAIDNGTRPPWNTPLGGEIMIHGMGGSSDWTAGCVAVDNDQMDILWEHGAIGVLVEIRP